MVCTHAWPDALHACKRINIQRAYVISKMWQSRAPTRPVMEDPWQLA